MRHLLIAAASFAIAIAPLAAHSQSAYPTKNIRLIVPVTTGGPSDLVGAIARRETCRRRSASR